jgi:hypothetical protein
MLNASYKMEASTSDKRMPITTSPYNVPSVDVIPDQPTFSLDTTLKTIKSPKKIFVSCIEYFGKFVFKRNQVNMLFFGVQTSLQRRAVRFSALSS